VSFSDLAKQLTEACTTRLGEPVGYRPRVGVKKTVQAVVQRDLEILGEHGQVIDRRTAVSLAKRDITDTIGAEITIGASEVRRVDAVAADDGEMIRLVLQ
jgi:hypothetical protein